MPSDRPFFPTDEAPAVNLRLLQQAVADLSEAVVITGPGSDDNGFEILYVNEAFTETTGYEQEEAVGRTPRMLQGPMTSPRVIHELQEALEAGERFEGEAINYRKDGSPYVNRWSIAPVRTDGAITHWVSVQRDVTDQRRMGRRLLEVQEEERRRIAQEIHDEAGGLLTTLQMSVAAARDGADEALDQIEAVASELATTIRSISRRMRPRLLDDYGLARALAWLTDELKTPGGPAFDLRVEGDPEDALDSVLQTTAYRVVQEALTNACRHAAATEVAVTAEITPQQVRLRIADDGVGFDPEALSETTVGLTGMRERTERLNGTFSIDTAPGEGTVVEAVLPRGPADAF
jgi:PAS domain S-box-containing protein